MAIKTKKVAKKKKSNMMMIILLVIIIVSIVIIYFGFIRTPKQEVLSVDAVQPISRIQTDFNTSILDDPRIDNFIQYGPQNVEVTQRGRKADPFQAF